MAQDAVVAVPVLDRPLYGTSQAAALLKVRTATARRWLDGYERAGVRYEPVVRERTTGDDVVTWGEFVELTYLREYRRRKVSLQHLRGVVQQLRRELGVPYALAHAKPYTSGRDLVFRVQEQTHLPDELQIVRCVDGQMQLAGPAQQFLDRIEFGDDDIASGFRPMGKGSTVLVSPDRAFGMPAVAGRNVRTEVLYEMWQAGDSPEEIAEGYDLTEDEVDDALRYEGRRVDSAA